MNGKQLKNSILQWAIQGKLVPQDPNDEPASALLERIRAEKARLVKEGKIKKDKNESIIYKGDDNSYYEKFADGKVVCIDDEIPFEIPAGWEWCRLSNVISLLSGQDLTPDRYFDTEMGIPYITGASHFVDGSIVISRWTKTPTSISKKGDLLITCKGTVGTMAYNTIGDVHIARQIMAITPICVCLKYLQIFLTFIVPELEKQAHSIIPGISRDILLNTIVSLPPLQEQIRISETIDKITPYLEKYTKTQNSLDALNSNIKVSLKRSILQDAIQGKLVPQIASEGDASVLLQQIEMEKQRLVKEGKLKKKDMVSSIIFRGDDNKYYEQIGSGTLDISEEIPFEIPDTWAWTRLGNLVSNNAGLAYSKGDLDKKSDKPIRVLRGGNISDGSWAVRDDDVMIAPEFVNPKLLLRKGTFITPAVTSLERMGKTALISDNLDDTVVGGFVLMLVPYHLDDTMLHYLLDFFQTTYYKQYCTSITNKSGQAFYNISRSKLMQCLVPIPPIQEQQRIVRKIDEIQTLIQ